MMLSGNNGILQRAGEAKNVTDDAQIIEQAELIKNAKLIEKNIKNEKLNKEELISAISNDNSFSGSNIDDTGVITTKEGKQIIVTEDLNILTGEKIKTESLKDGDHILLKLNGIDTAVECIVLYDSSSEVGANGVQVITGDVIEENVVLGAGNPNSEQDDMIPEALLQKSDAEKAQWSYNNAITNLNMDNSEISKNFLILLLINWTDCHGAFHIVDIDAVTVYSVNRVVKSLLSTTFSGQQWLVFIL